MAKATTTMVQRLNYQPHLAASFAANQAFFHQVVRFYFDVIQAHEQILQLGSQDALRTLEQLTHATDIHPHPVMPLSEIRQDIPAMFRRAAINAALGSAKSFQGNLKRWRTRKAKMEAKGKKFTDRPPMPPRTWNPQRGRSKSVPFYAGLQRERMENSIMLKVWTGAYCLWIKVRLSGRALPAGYIVLLIRSVPNTSVSTTIRCMVRPATPVCSSRKPPVSAVTAISIVPCRSAPSNATTWPSSL